MKKSPQSASLAYTTDDIRRYVRALPATDEMQSLDERTAQAARSVLGSTDPTWERRMRAQIDTITKEVAQYLDQDPKSGRYTVDANELRGIVARAVSRTSSQVAVDVGKTLSDATSMAEKLATAIETTDSPAPRLLGLQQEF